MTCRDKNWEYLDNVHHNQHLRRVQLPSCPLALLYSVECPEMSLPRISFLEGWDRYPDARRDAALSDTESENADLPEPSPLSSSFPSTYSRLNFNPYAGPGWNESADDREDRPSLFGSLLSPTVTRDSRVEPSPSADLGSGSPGSKDFWTETRPAYEVSPAKRIGMPNFRSVATVLTIFSPGVSSCAVLLSGCRNCVRLCCHQAGSDPRECIS